MAQGRSTLTLRVGLIGHGTIGRRVAEAVLTGHAGATRLVALLVRDPARIPPGSPVTGRESVRVLTDGPAFLACETDLVVEVGGHAALRQYAEAVLRAGKDLMTLSAGAFADAAFHERIRRLAQDLGRQVIIPSGAIAGLDAISAAALGEVEAVTHTTRKPPRAFTPEQLAASPHARTGGARVLYDGPARDGVGRFPENVNVAAAVSLAGIGLDRTRLRVIADPAVERNTHEVEVRGWFGQLRVVIENTPSENPKTGRLVALSVVKALRDRSAPLVVGA